MIEEVLSDLKRLSLKGLIKSIGSGSNSIGKTLQSELEIQHSTTSRNSYKGFTITATSTKVNRTNLFAKVPNWDRSEVKSSKEMLDLYGRDDPSGKYKKKLFCSVNSLDFNNFGLRLFVDMSKGVLYEKYSMGNQDRNVALWENEGLVQKLSSLDKTVVVSGNSFKREDGNYFHFRFAEFMVGPSMKKFLQLIDYGAITMDHLISMKAGSKNVREQGPLFKIAKVSKEDLFFTYKKFDLMDA